MTEKDKIIEYVDKNIDSLKSKTTRAIAKEIKSKFRITEKTIVNYVNIALKPYRLKKVEEVNHYGLKLEGAKVEIKQGGRMDRESKRGKIIRVFQDYFLVQFADYKEAFLRADITSDTDYSINVKTSKGWKTLRIKTKKWFDLRELEI